MLHICKHTICSMYIPSQLCPFPVNRKLHTQLYDPGVFVHVALASQSCVPCSHSSISVYVIVHCMT